MPGDYYEAADIDGASGVRQFFSITLPLISPTIFFVLVTRVIGALQVFDLIFMVMDKSNPALIKTQSLVYLFYEYSFRQKNQGYGSAIVVLLLAVITILPMFMTYQDLTLLPLYACCWFFFGFGLTALINAHILYRFFKNYLGDENP